MSKTVTFPTPKQAAFADSLAAQVVAGTAHFKDGVCIFIQKGGANRGSSAALRGYRMNKLVAAKAEALKGAMAPAPVVAPVVAPAETNLPTVASTEIKVVDGKTFYVYNVNFGKGKIAPHKVSYTKMQLTALAIKNPGIVQVAKNLSGKTVASVVA